MSDKTEIWRSDEKPDKENRLIKILVVSNYDDVRKVIKVFLSSANQVETAENVAEALTILEGSFRPDIIISEYIMPEADGFSFLSFLKNKSGYKAIPVIILSSISGHEVKTMFRDAGASEYFLKPVHPDSLRSSIDNILRSGKDRNNDEF